MPQAIRYLSLAFELVNPSQLYLLADASILNGAVPYIQGLLCGVCTDGYAQTPLGCEICKGNGHALGLLFLLVVGLWLLSLLLNRVLSAGGEAWLQLLMETRRSMQAVVKMVVTMGQILGSIPLVMGAIWKPLFFAHALLKSKLSAGTVHVCVVVSLALCGRVSHLLASPGFMFLEPFVSMVGFFKVFTVDLFGMLRVNCYTGNSFYTKFVAALSLPIGLIIFFVLFGESAGHFLPPFRWELLAHLLLKCQLLLQATSKPV